MELLVVFAIMVFAACLPVWYMSFNSRSLARELNTLQSWFLAMQQKALVTGEDIMVTIDKHHNRFTTSDDSFILNTSITLGVKPETYGPPSSPKELIKDPITFKNQQLCFYHNGALQVGTCYFIDQHGHSGALTCGLSQHGTIRCYELQGKQWRLIL